MQLILFALLALLAFTWLMARLRRPADRKRRGDGGYSGGDADRCDSGDCGGGDGGD